MSDNIDILGRCFGRLEYTYIRDEACVMKLSGYLIVICVVCVSRFVSGVFSDLSFVISVPMIRSQNPNIFRVRERCCCQTPDNGVPSLCRDLL